MRWHLGEIAAAVQGRLMGEDREVAGVATDTRADCAGKLFIALQGERFDAHDYLADALQKGAAALLIDRQDKWPVGIPAILVNDTRLALGQLAAAWRRRFDLPLTAITGSNGKTTSKEMLAAILKAALGEAVLSTTGNFNNDVGLPLTLLQLTPEHRAAVVEMGMNHPGEIAALTRIAQPDVALITNAQRAHLEGMGDLEAIAREKGRIYEGLGQEGIAIVNDDDAHAGLWRRLNAERQIIGFGFAHASDISGQAQPHGLKTRLTVDTPLGSRHLTLAAPGHHNALNALAAVAAAFALRIDLDAIVRGLENFTGVKGRLQHCNGPRGSVILDDTYNANPDSVRAGIAVLTATPGRQILVLGDMGEIGEASAQYHDEIGGYAKSMGIDRLYVLGEASQQAAHNFGDGARGFKTFEALLAALKEDISPGDTVLVKGSRFMKMERIVQALRAQPETSKERA